MLFKSKDNKWVGTIKSVKSKADKFIKIDSGATVTTLSLVTAASLIGWKKDDLASYLSGRESVIFEGIGGNVSLVPCKFHKISISNEIIEPFYCMVSTKDSIHRNLLGADFIGSCVGQIHYDNDIDLVGLNSGLYQRRFISQCKGAHAMELWSIDSLDSMDLVTKIIAGTVYAPSCEAWRGQNNYNTNTYEKELRHIVDMCQVRDVDALEEIIRSL